MKTEPTNICDEKRFSYLFKSLSEDLYKFLYYKYGTENNPRDIVQIAFEKLWNNCKLVDESKAKSYLYTVAVNEMLNSIARRKTVLNFRMNEPKSYTVESPEFLMEEKEYHQRLQNAIEELSEEQRTAFLLNRVEGKKHQEIADLLGISKKAVEKRIYTALKNLREKVETDKI